MSYPLSFPSAQPLLTVTNPKPYLWVIELHNGQDNRLTETLVDHGLKPALDAVEKHWREQWRPAQATKTKEGGAGALIIVGRRDQDKFFSNGLDFENAVANPNFFNDTLNPLFARLLTFPLPTIAAINGHCFAGGLMLSLTCDYRVMTDGTRRNAWLTMNEIHFGATWPRSFAAILRAKFPDQALVRKIALEGYRFTPKEGLEAGLLDHIVGGGTTTHVLAKAEEVAEGIKGNARTGVWGLIKRDLYKDTLQAIADDPRVIDSRAADRLAMARL
ncbi:hypothetical protein PLICRDRAFT_138074 [Plicaturopsis crispa FD-325 SS-3]|nr:hypothetical protein PLICRDRAFT_138074 [Plicaturopsis crispa FD-325 SS-3]